MTVNLRYHLLIGRDLARTIGDLSESLNLPRRVIELSIQEARLAGVPIVSGSEGLWIATDADELLQAAERLRERAVTQFMTVRAMRATARRMKAAGVTQEVMPWAA